MDRQDITDLVGQKIQDLCPGVGWCKQAQAELLGAALSPQKAQEWTPTKAGLETGSWLIPEFKS